MSVTNVTGFTSPIFSGFQIDPILTPPEEKTGSDLAVLEDEKTEPGKRNYLDQLYDKNRIGLNPVAGLMIRSHDRILEITGVWYQKGTRIRYDLKEYLLPSGWDRMISGAFDPARKLSEMKSFYPTKALELEAAVLENLISEGKLWWA